MRLLTLQDNVQGTRELSYYFSDKISRIPIKKYSIIHTVQVKVGNHNSEFLFLKEQIIEYVPTIDFYPRPDITVTQEQ